MIRVLIAFSSSNIGGAEKSLLKVYNSEEFSRVRGDLFFWQQGGPAEKLVETCYQNELNEEHSAYLLLISNLLSVGRLYKASLRNDIVYVIGWRLSLIFRFINWLGARKKIIVGIRWVPTSKTWLDFLFRQFEPRLQYFVCGYICNSQSASKLLKEIGINPSKIQVVYNGCDIPRHYKSTSNASQNSCIRIVTVANYAPRKGLIEYLNNVVVPIAKGRQDVLFYFIGRDDMNGLLKSEVCKLGLDACVDLVGYSNCVDEYLKLASIMVLPSLYGEGCPTSVIEAMSFGVPALGFDIDGMNECIIDNETGFIIEKFNYECLVAKLNLLFSDVELVNRLSIGSRQYFAQHFHLSNACKKHVDAILDLERNT